MRKLLLTFLLLTSFNTFAECFPELPVLNNGVWCTLCWDAPQHREDGTILDIAELSDYIIQVKNGIGEWVNYEYDLINTTTGVYWYSAEFCPNNEEIRIAATDIDGRQSLWAYPVSPPTNPLICQ